MLSPQAFVETWGEPTYAHQEDMQFYPVENGNYVPRFRVPVGEWPRGWDSTIVSEEARFLAYADRGELLGFVNDRLVYRERMSTEQIHAVGKMWQRESRCLKPAWRRIVHHRRNPDASIGTVLHCAIEDRSCHS